MITLHAVEERKKIGSCIVRVDYYIYILGRYIHQMVFSKCFEINVTGYNVSTPNFKFR